MSLNQARLDSLEEKLIAQAEAAEKAKAKSLKVKKEKVEEKFIKAKKK